MKTPYTEKQRRKLIIKEIENNPFIELIETNNVEGVRQYLQENTIDLNKRNESGNFPIIYAVCGGNLEIIDLLIRKGLDINQSNNEQLTAIHYGVVSGNLEVVSYLIEHGADINKVGPHYFTPLMYAVIKENQQMIEFLLSHGAKVSEEAERMALATN